MQPIEIILPKLQRIRQRTPDSWIASCPAHEDRSPSLSVSVREDGAVLIHCFAGCQKSAILAALGIQMSDLFPKRLDIHGPPLHRHPPWREIIGYLREDLTAVKIAAARLAAGDKLSEADLDRIGLAALRIHELLDMA